MLVGDVTILILVVCPPELLTSRRIHTGTLTQIEGIQRKSLLEALVSHVTDVGIITTEAGRYSHRVVQQHVGSLTMIVLCTETEATVQQLSFQTDI